MTIKMKEVLKEKFWIVQDEEMKIGTLSLADDRYLFNSARGTQFFSSKKDLNQNFDSNLTWGKLEIKEKHVEKTVYGFPTSCVPQNTMYDIKQKLPLFTKSIKSKSLYCAGYYTIKFEKGWVKSFCPKLMTLERYGFKGPFKTEFEMKQELSRVNKS